MKLAALAFGALACAPSLAIAAGFDELDASADRAIDRAEAARDAELERHFAAADTDNDGRLSREEFVLWRRKGARAPGPALLLPPLRAAPLHRRHRHRELN